MGRAVSRPAVSVDASAVLLVLALAGVGLLIASRGGFTRAAQSLGSGLVTGAGAVVSGGVDAVSQGIGMPGPGQTTTDPAVARWIIDNRGMLAASKWAGVPALVAGSTMPKGSGRPPEPGSAAARGLQVVQPTTGDFSRLDRLSQVPADFDHWRIEPPGWPEVPW